MTDKEHNFGFAEAVWSKKNIVNMMTNDGLSLTSIFSFWELIVL